MRFWRSYGPNRLYWLPMMDCLAKVLCGVGTLHGQHPLQAQLADDPPEFIPEPFDPRGVHGGLQQDGDVQVPTGSELG